MKVIYGIGSAKQQLFDRGGVLSIGVFDGLHRGHKRMIEKAVRQARKRKVISIVMTFYPHPVNILNPDIYLPAIVSLPYRLKLIASLGVDVCMVVRFTKRFASMLPDNFIRRYIVKTIAPVEVFIGADFRFGCNRMADTDYLQKRLSVFGIKVNVVNFVTLGGHKIGSNDIRKMIAVGQLKQASLLLGRPVSIMGKVSKGDKWGRKLGFPTANLIPDGEVLPPNGVYASRVIIEDKKFDAMSYIGTKPTFSLRNRVRIEVYIFGFSQELYGKEIIVEFIEKIRDEKRFSSPVALAEQLSRDLEQVKVLLRRRADIK